MDGPLHARNSRTHCISHRRWADCLGILFVCWCIRSGRRGGMEGCHCCQLNKRIGWKQQQRNTKRYTDCQHLQSGNCKGAHKNQHKAAAVYWWERGVGKDCKSPFLSCFICCIILKNIALGQSNWGAIFVCLAVVICIMGWGTVLSWGVVYCVVLSLPICWRIDGDQLTPNEIKSDTTTKDGL